MQKQRRIFLRILAAVSGLMITGIGSVFRPVLAFTERNKLAFTTNNQNTALENLFPGQTITTSDAIDISVHDLVENGAVVPVKINTGLTGVESISILVEKNPNPLIAQFKLNPRCQAFIATRIKVQQPSIITAVIQSEGKLFSATKFVEVIEGGCG